MKKILSFIVLMVGFVLGENAMAEGLNEAQKAIAESAIYTARGDQKGLKPALEKALDAGVKLEELKEILVQSYAYCGFPRSLNALGTLMTLEEERENRDVVQIDAPLAEIDSLSVGTLNQTKLVGAPVTGKLFEFAPQIDRYLKAHLFGDIFSRDVLDWKTRELATVAMLSARDGVESQLKSHIEIAKHNGVTDEQITEILALSGQIKAQNVLFGFGQENTQYAPYFIGKSYLQPLNAEGVNIANVTFEPKCRNNWHIHHKGGQILMVVAGRGWYQEWGKPAQELHPGDVVNIPAEVKHWHGAAKDSWFTHIALAVPAEGASNEWLEAVTDEEYNKLN